MGIQNINHESDTVKNILSGNIYLHTEEEEANTMGNTVIKERDKFRGKYKQMKNSVREVQTELNNTKAKFEEYKMKKAEKVNKLQSELNETKNKFNILTKELNIQTEKHISDHQEVENIKRIIQTQNERNNELEKEREDLYMELKYREKRNFGELEEEYRIKLTKLDEQIELLRRKEQEFIEREANISADYLEGHVKHRLHDILMENTSYYEGLDRFQIEKMPNNHIVNYIDQLIKHLIADKKYQEEKYNKLIDMHNQLLDNTYKHTGELGNNEFLILQRKYNLMTKDHE